MTDRTELAQAFVIANGWGTAQRSVLAGDASNRRYDRLIRDTGDKAVLMDAPPEKGEDVGPFVDITRFLRGIGLSAPDIIAEDRKHGLLLIEDLGDDLFARYIVSHPQAEEQLYAAATDVLTELHRHEPPGLATYDNSMMTDMAALAFDWYQMGAFGKVDADQKTRFKSVFRSSLAPLDQQDHVLIQRDYHAENLLWLPDRDGVEKVGLLDYQDAMLGHRAYDLVSILQDARRDVPQALADQMVDRYITQNAVQAEEFRTAYALLGAQRNLRILGVFARLCIRDGKSHYVDLIPRVWDHVLTNLAHPALNSVKELVLEAFPSPDTAILERLKAQCATLPKP